MMQGQMALRTGNKGYGCAVKETGQLGSQRFPKLKLGVKLVAVKATNGVWLVDDERGCKNP